MKAPTLKPISLRKRKDCEHPDITTYNEYLAKINGRYYAGKFTRQWYGWNFQAVYDAGFQLNWDGWQALWEIGR